MPVRATGMFSFAVSVVLLIAGLTSSACQAPPEPRQIAITIDDAPVMRFYSHPSQWHRMVVIDSMAAALARFGAPATIFVVGNQVEDPEGEELLRYWLSKGVALGNHSLSHTSFNELTLDEGRHEIARTNDLLAPFARAYDRPVRYFRFPFLAEGTTPERKAAWQGYLGQMGLRNARVTISNQDWKFDADYTEAELAEDWAKRYEIGQAYLRHIREAVAFWEGVGQEVAGRHVKHVLLLHANRINRDYLGQILAELRQQGYTFVGLDEAYADPIYASDDEWVSENGTSFLENVKQTRLKYIGAGE